MDPDCSRLKQPFCVLVRLELFLKLPVRLLALPLAVHDVRRLRRCIELHADAVDKLVQQLVSGVLRERGEPSERIVLLHVLLFYVNELVTLLRQRYVQRGHGH